MCKRVDGFLPGSFCGHGLVLVTLGCHASEALSNGFCTERTLRLLARLDSIALFFTRVSAAVYSSAGWALLRRHGSGQEQQAWAVSGDQYGWRLCQMPMIAAERLAFPCSIPA